ncbi:MAG: class I SAM-dependent methyltransferase [Planctomycetota bacterium]|nr:class I SAM-dependent methyltransferase [Planctomycetota bacterium]
MSRDQALAAGTGSSVVVKNCQICRSADLKSVFFVGYLPPVNHMRKIGQRPGEEAFYAAELLFCPTCTLVQLGLTVDKNILFPPEYPYTSGTTKILRENFAEMHRECVAQYSISTSDLVVDVGSNDGTLLSNWKNAGYRVHGIEPTDMGKLANERGIKTSVSFMGPEIAAKVLAEDGAAKVVTATNVFAHMEDIDTILGSMLKLLKDDGIFISESHYLVSLIETLQYDTIYHEHLRYYSLTSLQYLLNKHGLEIVHAKRIPTHGGSIRVYASRKGKHPVKDSVASILEHERSVGIDEAGLRAFGKRVLDSKLALCSMIADIKSRNGRIVGISAPSRASTLVHYVGLDEGVLDAVLEVKGSYKIGKYMPGRMIPVLEESYLFEKQPEYALLLSWHIADELMPKLREKGYKGKFIVPLPTPRIVG